MRLMEWLDSTLPLAARPYGLLSVRARRLHRDVYDMRLLFQKTTCMTGADAARVFYDPDRFVRADAAPRRLRLTLFGDDRGHRCAGEWITEDLMKVSVTALTRWMSYSVPAQDLRVHPWRAPAIPKSRFIVTQVAGARAAATADG